MSARWAPTANAQSLCCNDAVDGSHVALAEVSSNTRVYFYVAANTLVRTPSSREIVSGRPLALRLTKTQLSSTIREVLGFSLGRYRSREMAICM